MNSNKPKKNNNKFKGIFGSESVTINKIIFDIVSIFIAFYGILYAPQVLSILTCQQIDFIQKHRILQYILIFGLFYFIIVLVSDSEVDLPPTQKLINCFIYFILFIIINRLNNKLTIIVLGLFGLLYFIFLNKQYYYTVDPSTNNVELNNNSQNARNAVSVINKYSQNVDETSKTIQSHQYWITIDYPFILRLFPVTIPQYYYLSLLNKLIIVCIAICTILGFINYIGLLKYTFKNNITFYNILFENPNCKPLINKLGFFEYILLAFDYNYYIKKFGKNKV
jgi:hypothetical protein